MPQAVDIDNSAEDKIGAEHAIRCGDGYGIRCNSAGYELGASGSGAN
jgi:hypothetical protein